MKKVNVLDEGWIELQDVMGDDLAIVNAARTSYLGESKGEESDKKLLFYLMEHHHTTPLEMVEFKFRIRAPLVVWWQWVRHRTQSYNAQSGRYTEFDQFDFYLPSHWRLQDTKNKQGSSGYLEGSEAATLTSKYLDLCANAYELYQEALEKGVAREQARLFLPGFALYYTFVVKVNAKNLMDFLILRMADNAQWEIRQYAQVIWKEFFKPTLPWAAEAMEKFKINEKLSL